MSAMKYMTVQEQIIASINHSAEFLAIGLLDTSSAEKDVMRSELRLSYCLGTNLQKQMQDEYVYNLCALIIYYYMRDPNENVK